MHYSVFPNFVLPSCMKNGLIGSEETTITWAHSIDPVSVWYILQLKKTLKRQLSSSRRTQYIMWPNSLRIDVILLYDALDGRDTLAYFLTSIILDAKHEKKCREQPRVFLCLYPKVSSYSRQKLSGINKTRMICNSSKMVAFIGLRWPSLAFIGLRCPLWDWAFLRLGLSEVIFEVFARMQQNMKNLSIWIHLKPMFNQKNLGFPDDFFMFCIQDNWW